MPEEVEAEDGKADPKKKLFFCEVSGCRWWVFSPGRRWKVCGDRGPRSRPWGAEPGVVGRPANEGGCNVGNNAAGPWKSCWCQDSVNSACS